MGQTMLWTMCKIIEKISDKYLEYKQTSTLIKPVGTVSQICNRLLMKTFRYKERKSKKFAEWWNF